MLFNPSLLLLTLIPTTLAKLDKPVISPPFPNGLSTLDQGIKDNYPETSYTRKALTAIPQWCQTVAKQYNLTNEFKSWSIRYSDCADPWILCNHLSNPLSIDSTAKIFSRIPVRMRSYIRHILLLPGYDHAFNDGGNIALFGNTPKSMSVMVHEIGHSLTAEAYGGDGNFHDSPEWLAAYTTDTAVADAYALNNQNENHSQELVVSLFDFGGGAGGGKLTSRNLLPTINSGWKQISNQYKLIQKKLGNKLVQGGKCGARLENGNMVALGTKRSMSRVRSRVMGRERVEKGEFRIKGEVFKPNMKVDGVYEVDEFGGRV